MREADAQAVLLVQAVEEADGEGRLLPHAARTRATSAAREVAGEDEEALLRARARLLLEGLLEARPALARVLGSGRFGLGWMGALLVVTVALGLAGNALGPSRRINILFAPLLGLVAWNLAVYLLLLVRFVVTVGRRAGGAGRSTDAGAPARSGRPTAAAWQAGRRAGGRLAALAGWLLERGAGRRAARSAEDGAVLSAALGRYAERWRRVAAPLLAARLERLAHLGAAGLVLGTIAGMYVRGLALAYEAAWESTFLDAGGVRALLSIVLGPAAALTGQTLPPAEALPTRVAPADAAPWIHLWAATGAMAVLVPRTLLLLGTALRARRLARAVPLPLDASWARRLLAPGGGGHWRLDVVPIACRPEPRRRDALAALLHDRFGTRADLVVHEGLPYGAEASDVSALLDGAPSGKEAGPTSDGADPVARPPARAPDAAPGPNAAPGPDATPEQHASSRPDATPERCLVVLLGLAQTPETEVHGRLLRELTAALPACASLLVVVDGASYRARVGAAPGRLDERRRAWDRVLRESDLVPVHVDLDRPPDDDLIERLAAATWTAGR